MSIAPNLLPSYTYDHYKDWEGDWELIEGIPYSMVPSPIIKHQAISSTIILSLNGSIENCNQCLVLNEQDWKISEITTIRPDVVMICNEPGDKYITKRPEIAIEIISKSSIQKDEQIKFKLCEDEKVPYYIIVYPKDLKARVFKLENNKYTKVADFTHETLDFDGLPCKASINFEQVFKKFRP